MVLLLLAVKTSSQEVHLNLSDYFCFFAESLTWVFNMFIESQFHVIKFLRYKRRDFITKRQFSLNFLAATAHYSMNRAKFGKLKGTIVPFVKLTREIDFTSYS